MAMTERRRGGRKPWVPREERMVPKNFTLPPPQIDWLEAEATRRQVTASQIIRELLAGAMAGDSGAPGAEPLGGTGQELIEALTANGMIGAWKERTDLGDPAEFARKLRERVWTRTHD
jgi:hypothetical protein